MNKLLEDQMSWYASQPISYRRLWWQWAHAQPNFRDMLAWASIKEEDESVRRMMNYWAEKQ